MRVDYCEDAVDSTLTADSWDMSPPDYPVTPNCDTRGYNTHVCREGHPAPGCMMWEGPEETPTEQCPAETDPEHHDLSVGKSFHLMQLDPESLQNRSWHQMGSQAPSIGWHYWPSQQNWVLRMWYEMVSFLAPQVSRVVVTAADYIVSGPAQLNTGTGTCPASRTTVVDLALRPSSMPGPPRSYLVDAGHVLGRQLGGPGHDPLCVFPQSVAANRGAFAQLEGRVRDHVQVTGRPVIGSIRFDHDLTAQNQNGFAPSQFEITVQDANDPLQFYEHLHFWNLLAGQPILAPAPPTALPPIVDHPPPEPIGGPTSTWQQSWITIVVAIGVALLLLVILVCCYVRALKFPNRPTSSFSPPRLPVLVTIIPQMATSAPAQPAPLDGLTVTSEPASAPIRLHLAPSLTTGMVQQQLTLADQTRQEHHLPKQQAVQDESDV